MTSITMVIDFMCPWSFIGLRSLEIAKAEFIQNSGEASGIYFPPTTFIPFEFSPPGTYPSEGLDWTEYCEGFGPQKASFLLNEKLPKAFTLGENVGINFSIKRKIVHTNRVNMALLFAVQYGKGEEFASIMLSEHFENLRDPNEIDLLQDVLVHRLALPEDAVIAHLSTDPTIIAAMNAKETQRARSLPGWTGSVPQFTVMQGDTELRPAKVQRAHSPQYFAEIFSQLAPPTEKSQRGDEL